MKKKVFLTVCCLSMLFGGCTSVSNSSTEAGSTEVVNGTEIAEEENMLSPDDYDGKEYVTLGQYSGFTIDVPLADVSDDAVEESLDNLCLQNVSYEELDKTVVENGDYISVTLSAVDADDNSLDDYSTEETELLVGNDSYFTQLDEAFVGMTVGKEELVPVNVDADYFDSTIAGTTITFTVKVNSIDKKIVPEPTDDFIASVTEHSTIKEWKEAEKERLQKEAKEEQDYVFRAEIQERILANAEFKELPQELVESMINQYHSDDEESAEAMGYTFEELVTEYYGYADEEEYNQDLKSYVTDSIKLSFVLSVLQDELSIELTEDDLTAFKSECVEYYGFTDEAELIEYYGEDTVLKAALNDKTFEVLGGLSKMNPTANYTE